MWYRSRIEVVLMVNLCDVSKKKGKNYCIFILLIFNISLFRGYLIDCNLKLYTAIAANKSHIWRIGFWFSLCSVGARL